MKLLPQVKELQQFDGNFLLNNLIEIVVNKDDSESRSTASFMSKRLEEITLKKFPVTVSEKECSSKSILLECKLTEKSSEGYSIDCSPERIVISGDSPTGVFYGVQTLIQIFSLHPNSIPCFKIFDSPDIAHRGYYHDVTRGKVPKLETLKELVEKIASYKINELQLYMEHSFAFEQIPELWIDKDPITPDEILVLDKHCKKFHVDLIPSLATFGHLYELLRIKRFEHLNELDIKASALPHDLWDRMAHYTIDPLNEESLDLITLMLEEYIPLFSSKYFNVCCDETFDLGKGKNTQIANEIGVGRLYVNFLKKIIAVVIKHGKTPMFWGDIVLHHPELINEVPSNAIFLNWAYGADITEDATATFYKSGVTQYVCPGVSGWSRFANDINSASANIRKMIRYGNKYHCSGILNTDWGDCGHVNFISGSYHGMILGASLSWNANSYSSDSDFDAVVSHIEWSDQSGTIASELRELGSLCFYHFGNLYAWVNNLNGLWNKEEVLKNTSVSLLEENYKKADGIYDKISELQNSSKSLRKIDPEELLWSASAIRWTLALLIFKKVYEFHQDGSCFIDKDSLGRQCTYLCLEFKRLWRIRNKESELCNVVSTFKAILEKLSQIP
jgi:hypothetical protein